MAEQEQPRSRTQEQLEQDFTGPVTNLNIEAACVDFAKTMISATRTFGGNYVRRGSSSIRKDKNKQKQAEKNGEW